MAIGYGVQCQKPRTQKSLKRAADRREATVTKHVRGLCVERDGPCRIGRDEGYESCKGVSEWAHWGRYKRFKTQNMRPEVRHCTQGSLMLCKTHHYAYDHGPLKIRGISDQGCDGSLVYEWSQR